MEFWSFDHSFENKSSIILREVNYSSPLNFSPCINGADTQSEIPIITESLKLKEHT